MSDTAATTRTGTGFEEASSGLFGQLILQQVNMAMMLMGKVAHPATGETVRDLEAARVFIDVLEMLEVKTRGNLDRTEEAQLKQTLMAVRMAYVEAVESPEPAAGGKTEQRAGKADATREQGQPHGG